MILSLPTKYLFIEEIPLSRLVEFKEKRRLSLYCSKGVSCVKCGKKHERLIQGKDKGGGKHWDLYSEDLKSFLTVGHIIPKSRGGKDSIANTRPLCFKCNEKDSNSFDFLLEEKSLIPYIIGRKVRKENGNKFKGGILIATITSVFLGQDSHVYFGFLDNSRHSYRANKCIFV